MNFTLPTAIMVGEVISILGIVRALDLLSERVGLVHSTNRGHAWIHSAAEGMGMADESNDNVSPTPKVVLAFARAVRREAWEEVHSLLSAELQARLAVESVASDLDWNLVARRFEAPSGAGRGLHAARSLALGPPTCSEIFGVEVDDRPVGLGLPDSVYWNEIHFENDGFEVCYVCFLATREGRIVYYSVQPPDDEMSD